MIDDFVRYKKWNRQVGKFTKPATPVEAVEENHFVPRYIGMKASQ